MQIYRVGGSVRDELLGLPTQDADWVVVGATPQEMIALGYRPVGKDFPVFLHPDTHEEYALARTERKTGPGYKGFAVHFAPDVSLEEDLLRRDLTVNAMALDAEGSLIDPYDGQTDLQARLFRHVSEAFTEDPVRILRVARFAARFADFSVARETVDLMQKMVTAGEVTALVPERVWQELSRGLMSDSPMRMFRVLQDCGAADELLPDIAFDEHLQAALDWAVSHEIALSGRYALLCLAAKNGHATTDPDAVSERATHCEVLSASLRVPAECRDIAMIASREVAALARAGNASPDELLALIERIDGLRRGERLALVLDALNAWTLGNNEPGAQRLRAARACAAGVDAGAIARPLAKDGAKAISDAVASARVAAIAAGLTGSG